MLSLASGATAREITLNYNNLTLNANLELAEGNTLQDSMVLIVHGLMAHKKMELIESIQQALLNTRLSSLAINLSLSINNRQGFYDCHTNHHHLQDDAIDELAAWMRWLRQQGTNDVTLLAHSRGANQAMVFAAHNANLPLTRLVMLAPGVDDLSSQYEDRFGKVFDENLLRMRQLLANGQGNEPVSEIDFWYCPKASVTPRSFISYYGEDSPFRQVRTNLAKIPVPTLVISGTLDEREPNIIKNVEPFVDDKRIFLTIIEGAGHFFRDFNIDEAMEAVLEFVQKTP